MDTTPNRAMLSQLNESSPEHLLRWAWDSYHERAAIFTSFQHTGGVIIDMAQRVAPELRIIVVDTLRLPNETYALMDDFTRHYGITIERFKPDPRRLDEMVRNHGEFLFFNNQAGQELCCRVRKVEPNQRALDTVDVWIAGLRRDQSQRRTIIKKADLVTHRGRTIIKLCPLADWSEDQVLSYIRGHNVPYNPLYDKGYASIGCEICTTPILSGEDKRAGRWRWMNQHNESHHKECGLHTDGAGI